MIFPQQPTFPELDTYSTSETDQLQYQNPPGGFPQATPQPMSFPRLDMDMLMQDVHMSNFSLADLDALCSSPNDSIGMLVRYRPILNQTDFINSQ
jgi:hypothetical protein